ncbi:MAG: NAD-dependent epimerase/dehydratase family protein [Proteobacteria bacterium]|nr:NAD-dependent epimerase/dehydratase family protein [Pseudomonadota bacterium]
MVAVTGGSGQLGTLIVERLVNRHDVDVVVSIDVKPPGIASAKLRAVHADVRDGDLARHLAGCSALVHCAFLVTTNAPAPEFRAINVEGSINVFTAAAAAGVMTIVHLSSIMAYGCVRGHPVPITEDAARVEQPDFPYAACKFALEAYLDRFAAEHPHIAVCRIRPNVLLGRDVPHVLGRLLRYNLVPDLDEAPLPIVADEDVADLVLLALEKRARGAFNAAASDLRSADELAAAFGMHVLRIPMALVYPYMALDWGLKRIGSCLPYDAAWLTRTRGVTLVASSARARAELGWQPRYPTAESVLRRFHAIAPRRFDHDLRLALWLLARAGRRPDASLAGQVACVHLCVTGRNGGDRSLLVADARGRVLGGRPGHPTSAVIVGAATLAHILSRQIDIEAAAREGALRLEGDAGGRIILAWLVATLARLADESGPRGIAARAITRRLAKAGG